MNRLILLLLFCIPIQISALNFRIEARASLFIPQNHTLRKIYGSCFGNYELEASKPIFANLHKWINVGYTYQCGASIGQYDQTHMSLFPITTGLKYYFTNKHKLCPYIGFGLGTAFVHYHDRSELVKKHIGCWGICAVVKSGVEMTTFNCWYVNVFFDYALQWFSFKTRGKKYVHRHNPQTGGPRIGIGFGRRF